MVEALSSECGLPLRVILMVQVDSLSVSENGFIPVFPDGFVALSLECGGHLCRATFITDFELLCGALTRGGFLQFNAAAFDGQVKVIVPCARVTTRLGTGTGRHVGDAELDERISQLGWFAGAENDAYLWEADAEGGDELYEGAVIEEQIWIRRVLVVACIGAHAWEGDRERCLPAMLVKVLKVRGESHGFFFPWSETKEGSDAYAAEATRVGALRAGHAPFEFFLRAGSVKLGVDVLHIGLLVHDETFAAVVYDFLVLVVFHRADLDGDGGDERFDGVDTFLQVAIGYKFRVLARDEENVSEAERVQVLGLGDYLLHGERGAENGIVPREAAVGTVVDALVGNIEWREETHRLAEMPAGDALGFGGHGLELLIAGGGDQSLKLLQER